MCALQDEEVRHKTLDDLDLEPLTEQLRDEGAFKLSLPPDGDVLVRDKNALVFLLIKYSMVSA